MDKNNRVFQQPANSILPNRWDLIALCLVICLILSLGWAGMQMTEPFKLGHQTTISLAPSALPGYAIQTTVRMFIALFISLLFSMGVGTLAAKSKRAGKLIIPLIDVLQSVPIMGYLSISVAGLIVLFPNSMLGPEFAAIFAVFTSQVWNMLLSFYQSLITVPKELIEASRMYRLSSWQRFWRIEAPYAVPGLLWNAMMSMSGGWFFVVAAEAISVAHQQIMLPGIGSYIAVAISHKNLHAIAYVIIAMLIVILLYDQVIFRPLIAWSQKFKLADIEDDEEPTSWLLDIVQRTRLLQHTGKFFNALWSGFINLNLPFKTRKFSEKTQTSRISDFIWYSALILLASVILYLLWNEVVTRVPIADIGYTIFLGGCTALRVIVLIIVCLVIWVPIGIWVGLRPSVAKWVQPIAQFLAAFPANLLFPIFVVLIVKYNLNVNIWSAPLMILGTQWYILFNVIAGASMIPKELKLAAQNMQIKGWLRWRRFLLPAVFPYMLTGAITAAGGAWNASVVAEVIQWGHIKLTATGLGAFITEMTRAGNFPKLALGVVVMCLWVTFFNLTLWRKLYQYAETRFNYN